METKEEYQEALNRMEEAYYNLDNSMGAMRKFKEDVNLLTGLANVYFEEKQAIKSETNIEHYFEYLSEVGLGGFALVNGRCTKCSGTRCSECDFSGCDCCNKRLRWLSSPYRKKYKLTKFENDLLQSYVEGNLRKCMFKDISALMRMKEKGYFKDINTSIPIYEILDNCEVI